MKVLKSVIVSCNDLTTHEVDSIPSKGCSAVDIAKDIMKNGCWARPADDVAQYIPPAAITGIKFVRGDVADEDLEKEGYGPPDEK